MRKFSKEEKIGLGVIFFILFLISFPNFSLSIKRQRDSVRKAGLGNITTWVKEFQEVYSFYPASTDDGRIVACISENEEIVYDKDGLITNTLIPCEWGKKSFLGNLPQDPDFDKGATFRYISNGGRYQVFAALEDKGDDEFNKGVLSRSLSCGTRTCNTGRASSRTPVDKSLEEYENELNAQK